METYSSLIKDGKDLTTLSEHTGFLAEVDQSIFIEAKNGKRIIHLRSTKFPARTLRTADPENMKSEDFNLQEYITLLEQDQAKAVSYEL